MWPQEAIEIWTQQVLHAQGDAQLPNMHVQRKRKREPEAISASVNMPPPPPGSRAHSPSRGSMSSASVPISSNRKREASATEQLLAMRYALFPVESQEISNYTTDLPQEARSLAMDMAYIANTCGIVCAGWDGWTEQLSMGISPSLDSAMLDPGKATRVGTDADIHTVRRICKRAARNQERMCSEAAWSCGVHNYLLDAARDGSVVRDSVWWENLTTADIEAESAADTEAESAADAARKGVDFGIVLDTIDKHTQHRLFRAGYHTINHTPYLGTDFKPIAVSIEMKPVMGVGTKATILKLQTWALAQSNFLRRFAPPHKLPPILPLVMVIGHEWRMYYFETLPDRGILWRDNRPFGSTGGPRGAYQIIAGLQRLMTWAAYDYWPWFEENIIKSMLPASGEPPSTAAQAAF